MPYQPVHAHPTTNQPGYCAVLMHNQLLPLEVLLQRANNVFTKDCLEFIMNSIINQVERGNGSMETLLAEELYYHEGRQLAQSEQWCRMSYKQLEHECHAYQLLEPGITYTRFQLELRLRFHTREQPNTSIGQSMDDSESTSSDSGYHSGQFSGSESSESPDDDGEQESDDDEGSLPKGVKWCWRPDLGRHILMRI